MKNTVYWRKWIVAAAATAASDATAAKLSA